MVAARRGAALGLAALTVAAAMAGCGGGGGGSSSDSSKTRDLNILTRALARENRLIAASAAVGDRLGPDAGLGRRVLVTAETHTAYLTMAIRKLGGTPHQPRRDYAPVVGHPSDAAAALSLLAGIGHRIAAADRRAARRVSDEDFRTLTYAVAGSTRRHADELARAAAAA